MHLAKQTIETKCWSCEKHIHPDEMVLVDGAKVYCINGCGQRTIRENKSYLDLLLKRIEEN